MIRNQETYFVWSKLAIVQHCRWVNDEYDTIYSDNNIKNSLGCIVVLGVRYTLPLNNYYCMWWVWFEEQNLITFITTNHCIKWKTIQNENGLSAFISKDIF